MTDWPDVAQRSPLERAAWCADELAAAEARVATLRTMRDLCASQMRAAGYTVAEVSRATGLSARQAHRVTRDAVSAATRDRAAVAERLLLRLVDRHQPDDLDPLERTLIDLLRVDGPTRPVT